MFDRYCFRDCIVLGGDGCCADFKEPLVYSLGSYIAVVRSRSREEAAGMARFCYRRGEIWGGEGSVEPFACVARAVANDEAKESQQEQEHTRRQRGGLCWEGRSRGRVVQWSVGRITVVLRLWLLSLPGLDWAGLLGLLGWGMRDGRAGKMQWRWRYLVPGTGEATIIYRGLNDSLTGWIGLLDWTGLRLHWLLILLFSSSILTLTLTLTSTQAATHSSSTLLSMKDLRHRSNTSLFPCPKKLNLRTVEIHDSLSNLPPASHTTAMHSIPLQRTQQDPGRRLSPTSKHAWTDWARDEDEDGQSSYVCTELYLRIISYRTYLVCPF